MSDPEQPADPLSGWIDKEVPAEGQNVRIRAQNRHGFYIIPFPVVFKDDGWFNVLTGEKLDCFVAGWMPWDTAGDHDTSRRS